MCVFLQLCLCVSCASSGYIKDSQQYNRNAEGHICSHFLAYGVDGRAEVITFLLCLSQCDSSGLHYLCPLQTHASYLQFHSILQGCLPSARQAAPIVWPSCLIAAPTPPLAVFSYVSLVTWFSVKRQTETLTARGACLMEPHSEEKIANNNRGSREDGLCNSGREDGEWICILCVLNSVRY